MTSETDPYREIDDPKIAAKLEKILESKTFSSEEERDAFVEEWHEKYLRKRERARALRRAETEALREERAHQELLEAVSQVPPVAPPMRRRRRHWGLLLAFLLVVALPVVATGGYLYTRALDQFASTAAFTVRSNETSSATELLGGITQIVGGTGGSVNSDVLYEFIRSQEIVARIDAQVDLRAHYSATWETDPVFSLWPDATIEDLLWFWKRMVRTTYDKGTGLLMVEVRARDAETAQRISRLVVSESEAMINTLNETARRDSMASARNELEAVQARLIATREELAAFRARTQILDPLADIQGRMGVLSTLQQQLAEALVEFDLLIQAGNESDPRVQQQRRRISVIEARIAEERESFAARNVTVDNTDYPELLRQYEALQVEQEFAQETYRAALTALDSARSNAERQHLYLATYISPTLAQRAEYPRRLLVLALTAFFSLTLWAVAALVYYSLRDRG
ncbi:sugar transporter [Jannaschia marina]|uniref:sugar transporter n=1 Tax=Jannaschia marina TaxID=2741674 RepID=UPI0015C9A945|nr:sugar transporter [Jannaschia marina]